MNGDSLRDQGQEAAIANEPGRWTKEYLVLAHQYISGLPDGLTFSGDQVNAFIKLVVNEEPHSPQVKSAQFAKFIRPLLENGKVEVVGFEKSVKASNHSRYVRKYRKVA